jgi:hypothetical protein
MRSLLPVHHSIKQWITIPTVSNENTEVEFGITTETYVICAAWLSYKIRIYMFRN